MIHQGGLRKLRSLGALFLEVRLVLGEEQMERKTYKETRLYELSELIARESMCVRRDGVSEILLSIL
jgi:hypothetical protein